MSRIAAFLFASVFAVAGCAVPTGETGPTEQESTETTGTLAAPITAETQKVPYLPTGTGGTGYTPYCGDGWDPPTHCPTGTVICGCYCKTLAQCKATRPQ